MEPLYVPPKQSPPRKLVIDNEAFGYSNIEAWANIIRSYVEKHPGHRVNLIYHGEPVQSLTYLFKLGKTVDRDAFQVSVAAPDQDFRQVTKLCRLLVEGAGPDFKKFIVKDLHRTLKLF
jgi:hypothetical protein